MTTAQKEAPGVPGRKGRWTSSAKTGVGTALSTDSSIWFTLCHGIVTEVYYPFLDAACIRDMEFLVTDRHDFFSEEKVDTDSQVDYLKHAVPAFHLINKCKHGHYVLEKTILCDPRRSVLLLQVHFKPLKGTLDDYALFVLLNSHLNNQSAEDTAWVGDFKGQPMLFAEYEGTGLALACSSPWRKRSVGFVGTSDGWQDVKQHKQMEWVYERAEKGNVALTGEIDLTQTDGKFILALGFGRDDGEAGHRVRASLLQGFDDARDAYVKQWSDWLAEIRHEEPNPHREEDLNHISAMVIRLHEAKEFPGGIAASLSIPWGEVQGDGFMGYHLVWPRDMIQTVGAQLAINKHEDARRVLFYFQVTQDADGHWPQNMWLDGKACWNGIQLDETAFVILLVDLARRYSALKEDAIHRLWPMVRNAASYLVRHGPVTPMDRWEEASGYFASTIAIEVPALLIAADLADEEGEHQLAVYLRETADTWNDMIESLIYVRDTDMAREVGVDGYYVRFAAPGQMEATKPAAGLVKIANHPSGEDKFPAANIISPDALCLVRYGLRDANDPRIVNTIRVIDQYLKVDMPKGPCWRRYLHDGYGEHADGAPFDGTGIGRAWPLLTAERALYELAAGHKDEAGRLLKAMESFASDTGLLSEQIWDTEDIPEHNLCFGKPSGSAMPLVWAHAEYVKLRCSLRDGKVYDTPPQAVERYLKEKTTSPHVFWRPDQKRRAMPCGKVLRVELPYPATVRWNDAGGKNSHAVMTRATGLGIHVADLSTRELSASAEVVFTIEGRDDGKGEGQEYRVKIERDSPRNA